MLPIPALAAVAALKAIPAAYQLGTGIVQGVRARRMAKNAKRPVYEIPKEILDNHGIAKRAYGAASMYGLPGQGRIQAGMDQQTAGSARNIAMSQQSPSAQLMGYAALDQNSKNAQNNLGIQSAQFRQGNMDRTRGGLMNANQILAQYKDKAFDYNKTKPFEATMAAISALRAGAIQNIYGGLSAGADIAAGAVSRSPQKAAGGMTGGGSLDRASTGISTGQPTSFDADYASQLSAMRNSPRFAHLSDSEFYEMFGRQ